MPETLSVEELPLTAPAAPVLLPAAGRTLRPRTRRRFWAALTLALAVALLASPAPWQTLVRVTLIRQAARHGGELSIEGMAGGPLEALHLYGVRLRPRLRPASPGAGTDLCADHAQLTFDWALPFVQAAPATRLRRVVLDGVHGQVDLSEPPGDPAPAARRASSGGLARWLDRHVPRLMPAGFAVQADDLILRRGRYSIRGRGVRLTGEPAAAGMLLVRETEIAGPGFRNTFPNRRGQTFWQGGRLTVTNVDFGDGLLASATLDGARLTQHRLIWDGALVSATGALRGQGSVNFARPRLNLEVAGTMHGLSVATVARLLGLGGPADGTVAQGSFSFRGDPDDWPAAEGWLAANATGLRWNQRTCESLDLQASIMRRRVQVTRLELRQSGNRVSLQGEGPLPAARGAAPTREGGPFTGSVDARLDDLHALAQLLGPRCPDLRGRISVNGHLEASPGLPEVRGYFNVEGSALALQGVPLDYLRSTLIFRDGECRVADAQATRGSDFFTGQGTVGLVGPARYQGHFRVAAQDPSAYAPAVAGWLNTSPTAELFSPMRLEGFFCGPDDAGETLLQTFDVGEGSFVNSLPLPAFPLPEMTTLHLN